MQLNSFDILHYAFQISHQNCKSFEDVNLGMLFLGKYVLGRTYVKLRPVETGGDFKGILDHLPKLPFSRYFKWIYIASAYKNYVLIMIRADVNAGDFLKDVLNKEDFWDMRLIYHKCWRLSNNTGELEFMAWDAMLIFFYVDLSYYKERQYFALSFIAYIRTFIIAYLVLHCPPHSILHILFLEAATESYSLK